MPPPSATAWCRSGWSSEVQLLPKGSRDVGTQLRRASSVGAMLPASAGQPLADLLPPRIAWCGRRKRSGDPYGEPVGAVHAEAAAARRVFRGGLSVERVTLMPDRHPSGRYTGSFRSGDGRAAPKRSSAVCSGLSDDAIKLLYTGDVCQSPGRGSPSRAGPNRAAIRDDEWESCSR